MAKVDVSKLKAQNNDNDSLSMIEWDASFLSSGGSSYNPLINGSLTGKMQRNDSMLNMNLYSDEISEVTEVELDESVKELQLRSNSMLSVEESGSVMVDETNKKNIDTLGEIMNHVPIVSENVLPDDV